MGHPGKHIIDPETGLCEICDEGALEEVNQGKRPGKQIVYENDDDEVPHTKDEYDYESPDEPRLRHGRRTIYPTPTGQPRRVVYEQPIEEPIVIRRKVVPVDRAPPEHVIVRRSRPDRSPPEHVIVRRPRPDRSPREHVIVRRPPPPARRSSTYYYVDDDNQMIPQSEPPPTKSPRRYVVENRDPPQERPVRVIRRRVQTPPPPAIEPLHLGPRRLINSDTEAIQRQQRIDHDNDDYDVDDARFSPEAPIKPTVYYIEAVSDHPGSSPLVTPVYTPPDNRTPSPKIIHQEYRNQKSARVEPLERRSQYPPEPTVVRRVYKKLPPGRKERSNNAFIPDDYRTPVRRIGPPANRFVSNENRPPPVRRNGPPPNRFVSNENRPPPVRGNGRNLPPPSKHYSSSPELNNRNPDSVKRPAIFYIRNRDEYE